MTAPANPVTGWASEAKIKADLNYATAAVIADDQNLKSGTLLSLNASNKLQTATNWDILEWVSKDEIVVDTNTYSKKANYRRIHEEDTYIFKTSATIAAGVIGYFYGFNSDQKVDPTTGRAKWDLTRQLQLIEILSSTTAVFRIIPATATEEIITRTVKLPTAWILTSFTTPLTLIPAPGAGKAIRLMDLTAVMDYNSAAYASNTTFEVRYTDWSGTKVTADISSLLAATSDTYINVWGIEAQLALTANAAVVIRTATGNPTAGNSDIYVTVVYRVVSLA